MSGSAAGSTKLVKPGYHIRPKYDLHGLRHRRDDHGRGGVASELPLTALIDMFSVLVIYLLMNFSSTGEVFFVNKNLTVPKASKSNPLANGPIISVVGEQFVLDVPPEYEFPGAIEDNSPSLERISAALKQLKVIAENKKIDAQGRVNLQASEDADAGLIKRAMTASVTAGWTNVNFVTSKKDP